METLHVKKKTGSKKALKKKFNEIYNLLKTSSVFRTRGYYGTGNGETYFNYADTSGPITISSAPVQFVYIDAVEDKPNSHYSDHILSLTCKDAINDEILYSNSVNVSAFGVVSLMYSNSSHPFYASAYITLGFNSGRYVAANINISYY